MEFVVLASTKRGVHLCGLHEAPPSAELIGALRPASFAASFANTYGSAIGREECRSVGAALAAAHAGDETALREALGIAPLGERDAALADLVYRTSRSFRSAAHLKEFEDVTAAELLAAVREGDLAPDSTFHGGQTLLQLAGGKLGSLALVRELLDPAGRHAARAGASINRRDGEGLTALARAVCNGQHEAVLALLAAGADPSTHDNAGVTPFGHSVRNVHYDARHARPRSHAYAAAHAALEATMVPWAVVAALLADEALRAAPLKLCDHLCELAFSDGGGGGGTAGACAEERRASAAIPPASVGAGAPAAAGADRLQLSSQWVGREALVERGATAEQRAGAVADAVVLPLLRLAGRKALAGRAKRFARYALGAGVLRAAPAPTRSRARQAVAQALALLEAELAVHYGEPAVAALADLTPGGAEELRGGLSAFHQLSAHGPLPWLAELDVAAALRALLGAGATPSSVVRMVGTLPSVFGSTDALTLRAFWSEVYAWWLRLVAARADDQIRPWLEARFGGGGKEAGMFHGAPPKGAARVAEKKGEYRQLSAALSALPMLVKCRPGGPGGGFRSNPEQDVSLGHPLEAGGMGDLCRFSLVCETPAQLRDVFAALSALRLDGSGSGSAAGLAADVVRVKNGFHPSSSAIGGYRDVKLNLRVRVQLDGGGQATTVDHIVEAQLLLQSYADVKAHMHLLYKVQRGDFWDDDDE